MYSLMNGPGFYRRITAVLLSTRSFTTRGPIPRSQVMLVLEAEKPTGLRASLAACCPLVVTSVPVRCSLYYHVDN